MPRCFGPRCGATRAATHSSVRYVRRPTASPTASLSDLRSTRLHKEQGKEPVPGGASRRLTGAVRSKSGGGGRAGGGGTATLGERDRRPVGRPGSAVDRSRRESC